MSTRSFRRQTFIIQILNNQHSSWQGTLTWVDSNTTKEFRSALELIRLMDSAVETKEEKSGKDTCPVNCLDQVTEM